MMEHPPASTITTISLDVGAQNAHGLPHSPSNPAGATKAPPKKQRQNSNTAAQPKPLDSKSNPRNLRNLSLAPLPIPPISPIPSSSGYASLGETASLLSPTPTPLHYSSSTTPRFGPVPLQINPSSRPGTPSLRPSSAFGRPQTPRTPGLGLVPLTPNTPAGVIFSPGTPLFSPNPQSPAPTKASKLKSQLTSLLPVLPARHTFFHAKIEVQQLSSVPFVGGEFGVRWKFKNVHRHAGHQDEGGAHGHHGNDEGQGLLGRVTGRAKNATVKDKGKAREQDSVMEFGSADGHQNSVASTATTSSMDMDTTTSESSHSTSTSTWSSTSAPSVYSSSSTATKVPPNANGSRGFYSPSSSTEAQYGPSQYLFSGEGSTTSSTASTPADTGSLLFSANGQSFSSNAALGSVAPSLNVLSPTLTITQGNYQNNNQSRPGTPLSKNNAQLGGGGGQPIQIGHLSAAKGMTGHLPLKDHNVNFNFPLEAIVKMDVTRTGGQAFAPVDVGGEPHDGGPGSFLNPNDPHSRSSTSVSSMMFVASPPATIQQTQSKPNLHPSPLKLVVMQRVIPDDPSNTPQNPRLGAVFLNLAEYVGKGKVERRFLLKESKVNATLKLSIEITYMSGYAGYVAPPLHKAEILGGIEGFLTQRETKKKTLNTGGTAKPAYIGRELGNVRDRANGNEGEEGAGESGDEKEVEVDLLAPGLLEREKDRIGEGLLASIRGRGPPGEAIVSGVGITRIETGWDERAQAVVRAGVRVNIHARNDVDPYALPSDSESESEYGAIRLKSGSQAAREQALTEEELGRRRWKEELKARRMEERARAKHLDSGESDGDDSLFESADEGYNEVEGAVVDSASSLNDSARLRVSAFDIQQLPLSYGPKTTESLIDALFNPSLTTDSESQGPFTVYVDPRELQAQQALEEELRREMEQQIHSIQYQEPILLEQRQKRQRRQNQQPHHHWYQSKKRSMSGDTEGSSGRSSLGGGSGLKIRPHKGPNRAETMDSTGSVSTASGSGSGSSPGVQLTNMKSPGRDTIVGVRTGGDDEVDEPDVASPATITAFSPTRDRFHGHQRFGLGMNVEGGGIPSDKDREATIGKTPGGAGAVGNFLHNYYRSKKDKDKEKGEAKEVEVDTAGNILGGRYFEQEPQEMYGQLGHGPPPSMDVHDRHATMSSSSSSSLSSLSLGSRSASGHGHNNAGAIAGPPISPGAVTTGAISHARRRSSTSTGEAANLHPVRPRQPDLSVPDGRMDKMGVVKGTISQNTIIQEGGNVGGFGSSLKGWWKGLQK